MSLPPLGTKRNTQPNKRLESNSTAFELIPEKIQLPPLAVRRGIDSKAFESSPIPALKHSLEGRKLAPNQQALAPLNTGNDMSISSFPDPLSKPLHPLLLAPLGVSHSNISLSDSTSSVADPLTKPLHPLLLAPLGVPHSDSPCKSSIKHPLGNVVSAMTKSSGHNERPMEILGVSQSNTLGPIASSEQAEPECKQYNWVGEFPTNDDGVSSSNKVFMHQALWDVDVYRRRHGRKKRGRNKRRKRIRHRTRRTRRDRCRRGRRPRCRHARRPHARRRARNRRRNKHRVGRLLARLDVRVVVPRKEHSISRDRIGLMSVHTACGEMRQRQPTRWCQSGTHIRRENRRWRCAWQRRRPTRRQTRRSRRAQRQHVHRQHTQHRHRKKQRRTMRLNCNQWQQSEKYDEWYWY